MLLKTLNVHLQYLEWYLSNNWPLPKKFNYSLL